MNGSVCLSVRPSHVFDYVIVSLWNFQEWLPVTKVTSMLKFKLRGQRSGHIKTQFIRFWTVTQIKIHRWLQNDAKSLSGYRRGALLFSRSFLKFQGHRGAKNHQIWLIWAFLDCNSAFLAFLMSFPMFWLNHSWLQFYEGCFKACCWAENKKNTPLLISFLSAKHCQHILMA